MEMLLSPKHTPDTIDCLNRSGMALFKFSIEGSIAHLIYWRYAWRFQKISVLSYRILDFSFFFSSGCAIGEAHAPDSIFFFKILFENPIKILEMPILSSTEFYKSSTCRTPVELLKNPYVYRVLQSSTISTIGGVLQKFYIEFLNVYLKIKPAVQDHDKNKKAE